MAHRAWECPALEDLRKEVFDEEVLAWAAKGGSQTLLGSTGIGVHIEKPKELVKEYRQNGKSK